MKAYKVLIKKRGRLRSCTVKGRNAAITYIKGKAVHAPEWLAKQGYHLCVFRSHIAAKTFAGVGDKIWLVSAKRVLQKLPPMLDPDYFCRKEIDLSIAPWPMGTMMAKSVTLIKEVEGRVES